MRGHQAWLAPWFAACVAVGVVSSSAAQNLLNPGDAVVTKFSGATIGAGGPVIDPDGSSAIGLSLSGPGAAPNGSNASAAFPQSLQVPASEIGQVFGLAIRPGDPPTIYFSATSAFGLHLAETGDWMPGQWGKDGGPGTIYELSAAEGAVPEIFADVTLGPRENSGAALGALAYDPFSNSLFASDLETGMIHRFDADTGEEVGRYDHGVEGRANFYDVPAEGTASLPPIGFDPESAAQMEDCPSGDFARSPSCWNFADFRRRVYGLGVFHDLLLNQSRLFYSVWGSQGFGNPDYAGAGDEQKNSVWSMRISAEGEFDLTDVRREFFLPDFFRSPEAIARAGLSNPVTDITFASASGEEVMLLAERGGVRNLGLGAEAAFAYPHEARVLRYELDDEDGSWDPVGRYDVGYYDRNADGPPYLRANASGGVSFGMGYGDTWELDAAQPDAFVWMTGDGLCSTAGPCYDPEADDHTDVSLIDGIQGGAAHEYGEVEPDEAFQPYPSPGPAYPPDGPVASFMVDTNGDVATDDASRIGNIEVYQPGPVHIAEAPLYEGPPEGYPPDYDAPYEPGWDPAPLPDDDDDGWWPPPPIFLETDLAVQKTGPLTCQEGVDCSYTLTITNLGPLPFIGPLALFDTMPPGASLSTASPGWDCIVSAPDVSCVTIGFALLPVGGTATLHLDVLLPTPIPAGQVTNCAGIDWFEMGTDDGPGDFNDYVCINTPVDPGFNLGLQKDGVANCAEGASCPFLITITNFGPGTLNGVLAFHDTLPAGATFLSAGGGMGCVQVATALDCQASGVTLPMGGMAMVLMQIKLPIGGAGGTLENCAEIDWGEMGANDGEPDPHADQDCHTVNVVPLAGLFDLTVQKSGPAHCDPGANCTYEIKLTNEGPDDYTGAVLIRDNMPMGSAFVSSSPGWACITLALVTSCDLAGAPHTLHPGDSKSLTLTILLPAPIATPTVTNCTSIRFGDPGMPVNDNPPPPAFFEKPDSDCISTNVTDGFDLEITKTGPAFCFEGHVCDYQISVTNAGPRTIQAADVIAIKDTMPAGATVESVSIGWSCFPAGPATTTCVKEHAALPPGTTSTFTLGVRLPDPVIGLTVDNCAAMEWNVAFPGGPDPTYTSDDDGGTDGPVCVTTPVLAADLAPFGGTVCEKGASCTLDVSIDNLGGRLFQGAVGLRGNLNPAVNISSIESFTEGMACEVTGEGSYECNAPDLTLKAGDKAPFRVLIDIPADFSERRIVHQKEMIWPDTRVKDAQPQNDRHVSIIVINQPEEPLCEGGEVVDGRCVCPQGMELRQTGDNAFQCLPPPPPEIACEGGRVQRGECACPEGFERRQTGENAFECVEPPPPEIVCEGGRVRNNRCVCPEGTERQQTGDNAWRCVIPPPPELMCEGGRIRADRCVCPEGAEREQIGENAYRCVEPPPPEVVCEGGRVRNNRCVCPEGTERQSTGENAWRCVEPPPPEIVCEGGRVRNNRCVCPESTERQSTGENAWRCVEPPPPEIVCEGGRVRNNRCVCPEGTERRSTGENAWRCVEPPPPEIVCEGGRVRNNRCVCPEGTERQSTGENAWRCVEPPPPEIVCEGGRVRNGRCVCPRGSEQQQTGENSFVCIQIPVIEPEPEPGQQEPDQQIPRLQIPRFQLQVPQ